MGNGLIFGKFAPLHSGHLYLISYAASQCDTLLVILSYDSKIVNQRTNMQCDVRKEHLTTAILKLGLPNVIVDVVDESDLLPYPDGWDDYQDLIRHTAYDHFNNEPDYIFSSEPSYTEKLNEYFPNTEHVVVDYRREHFNISATQLRDNVYDFWDMIPTHVRKDYTLKVCVIGTESSGKTTLCNQLAILYGTGFVPEYGRLFVENELGKDESLLKYHHYDIIVEKHRKQIDEQMKHGDKVTIIDTNALITAFYQKLYEGSVSQVVDKFACAEKYDLVIYLDDDVEWVDDGMRSSGDRREYTKLMLTGLLEHYDVDYTVINGTYHERLDKAVKLINQYLNGTYS